MSDEKNFEEIYDEKISPLMKQVISICKEHKIPMIADFFLRNDEGGNFTAFTALCEEDFDPPEYYLEAIKLFRKKPVVMTSITVETK
jgi:hypothetical protein